MELIVIGSSNIDMVIYLPWIPGVGETLLGGKSRMIFGGKGANQAIAAARSGGKISFITKLGNDIFGKNTRDHFIKEGLPSACILSDENEPTGLAQILVSDKGENSIAVAPGANMKLSVEDVTAFENDIKNAGVVLLQLEIPLETVAYAADIAHKNGVKVILNPAPAQALTQELLKKVWLLTPNESETELLTGIKVNDVESAALAGKALLDQGVRNVLITMGAHGSLLCNEEGQKHFGAYKATAVDTTAAGDVFNGALAVALTKNKSLEEAIAYGSAAAAISVTREGAQPSIPDIDEVEQFMKASGS